MMLKVTVNWNFPSFSSEILLLLSFFNLSYHIPSVITGMKAQI